MFNKQSRCSLFKTPLPSCDITVLYSEIYKVHSSSYLTRWTLFSNTKLEIIFEQVIQRIHRLIMVPRATLKHSHCVEPFKWMREIYHFLSIHGHSQGSHSQLRVLVKDRA